ncbi:MAG TPA: TIGR03435 family protein, partial [Acidobacteriaceae bacterium]|nr:TIGR03435 family protein [Acidobacteriaceae bacterium]
MKNAWIRAGISLLVCNVALFAQAQTQTAPAGKDLTGQWQGTLQQGKGQRQVLKISKDGAQYKGVLYSIDQGSRTMAIPAITLDGNTVRFEIKQVNAVYEGTLSPDGNSISGSAKSANGELRALNLAHVSGDAAWAIPEPPKPMAADAHPRFDVLTVKPSDPNRPGMLVTLDGRRLKTINTPVSILIAFAYGIQQKQIVNGPAWLNERYDIDGVPDVEGTPNDQQMRMLVADALVQRFGLKFHHEQKELPVYALTVAKGGPKLTVTADAPSAPGNFLYSAPGRLHVTNNTMKEFCKAMQESTMDKPVVDQTGLTDRYDFQLNWTPDQS